MAKKNRTAKPVEPVNVEQTVSEVIDEMAEVLDTGYVDENPEPLKEEVMSNQNVMTQMQATAAATAAPVQMDRDSVAAVRLLAASFKLVIPGSDAWHHTMLPFVKEYVLGGQWGNPQAIELSKNLFLLAGLSAEDMAEIMSASAGDVVWADDRGTTKLARVFVEPAFYVGHKDMLRSFVRILKIMAGFAKKPLAVQASDEDGLSIGWQVGNFEDSVSRFNLKMDAVKKNKR